MGSLHVRVMVLCLAVLAVSLAQAQAPAPAHCDEACLQTKVDRHLLMMGEPGNEEKLQASQRELASHGAPVVRVTREIDNRWRRIQRMEHKPDPAGESFALDVQKAGIRAGEMRWRVVYLLGSLGLPDAVPALRDLARQPLPDPLHDEVLYADEVRIRMRAIAGLQNHKAIDELKQLHEIGGVLKNAAAASLFELGVNVGNVRLVEAKRALAEDVADAKDYNPNRGRAAQPDLPGSGRPMQKRREDTPKSRKEQ